MQQKIQQAIQLYQRGYQPQAEQICRNILKDYPRQADALLLMGLLEKDRGSLKQDRQLFQKGLKAAPKNLHLLNSLGSVENMLNEPVKAEAYFIKALKIDPGLKDPGFRGFKFAVKLMPAWFNQSLPICAST